jgi:acetolactate synthase-1/2/3 large subunit
LVVAGVGVRGAEAELARFAADHRTPVLTTYKAKGALDERSELAAGLLTGAEIESPILASADVILAVGLDPVELIPAPWNYAAPIVSIGPWSTPDRYFTPAVELTGQIPDLLDAIAEGTVDGSAWGRRVVEYRLDARASLIGSTRDGSLAPTDVLVAAHDAFGRDAVVTVDAGAHMLPAMELWTVGGPGRVLISSGLATMGFALPAAIAAALVNATSPIVCLTGDGGLGMCLAELETIVRFDLNVTVVVINDTCLSLIAVKQRTHQGGTAAVSYTDTDFAAVARGMGLAAERVDRADALAAALARAAVTAGPSLIDAVIDPSAYAQIMRRIRGNGEGRPARLLPS